MVDEKGTVSQRLLELRRDFGLSQEGLARRLEVSVSTVAKWERNDSLPGARALLRLAEIFNVSINWLLLGVGPKFLR